MKKHLRLVSSERVAKAISSTSVIPLKQFSVTILVAVNNLLARKAAANNS